MIGTALMLARGIALLSPYTWGLVGARLQLIFRPITLMFCPIITTEQITLVPLCGCREFPIIPNKHTSTSSRDGTNVVLADLQVTSFVPIAEIVSTLFNGFCC